MSGQSLATEAHFGPPSECIKISDFLHEVAALEQSSHKVFAQSADSLGDVAQNAWTALSDERRASIEAECGVQDVRKALGDVITEPRLMAHVMRSHELFTHSIYETAEVSGRKKRKRLTVEEPAEEHPQVTSLRRSLEGVRLRCWPLTLHSALFIRPPKQSDHNTLTSTKYLSLSVSTTQEAANRSSEALLFVTVYDRLTWGHKLISRSSQHVLLSSHTLGDMFDSIPCTSNEMPERQPDGSWTDAPAAGGGSGAVIFLEDTAYGDGLSDKDYSDKLMECLGVLSEKKRTAVEKGRAMHDVTFRSLELRLHHPYWLCHAGNCEHFFVIEHLRAHHASDPPLSAFPLTTQITPPLLDTCRACNKAPAVSAVTGDIRLGESPFMICGPCWRWMGAPKGEDAEKVEVVPLPKHEFGWCV